MTRCTSPRAPATVRARARGVCQSRAPLTRPLLPSAPPPPLPSVPRILFYTPSHDLLDITSGNDKFKYFYGDDAAIAANMQQAVARVAAGAKVAEDWEKPQDL